ncbi:MAG TPA: HAMP domain-containing sensor histidine kinase [Vicinamibacterales bacterium]|nr:HAMP domain-containing sensor histidine kinase [Vicinamibacterales bacterium]
MHRQIYWSLVGTMTFASVLTLAGFFAWSNNIFHSGWAGLAFPLLILALLWLSSGRLAYRLVRPLHRLVDVVQRLGEGDLTARARFPASSRDEVARVAHAIDLMADRLERQVRDERRLLAIVSHELRTPLARIRVLTDLARDGKSDAVDEIDREVFEIDDLISKVLAQSRLAFGTMTPRSIRLADAAAEALERVSLPRGLLDEEGTLVSDTVRADPTLLHRAIANLLDNAQKHGRGPTCVAVRTAATGVSLEVCDSGPGFPDGDPATRFEEFAPESSGGRGEGLGLGLHLVKRIVTVHGGRVWAENRAEGGARVGFELPHEA